MAFIVPGIPTKAETQVGHTCSTVLAGPVQNMQSLMGYTYSMTTTQKTPKGKDIPIPKRSDFLRNLKKAAAPPKSRRSRRPKK